MQMVDALLMNDRVLVDDDRRGTVIGFYAREERTVVVRLDVDGVREVLECNVAPAPEGRKSPEQLYEELAETIDLGGSEIDVR